MSLTTEGYFVPSNCPAARGTVVLRLVLKNSTHLNTSQALKLYRVLRRETDKSGREDESRHAVRLEIIEMNEEKNSTNRGELKATSSAEALPVHSTSTQ